MSADARYLKHRPIAKGPEVQASAGVIMATDHLIDRPQLSISPTIFVWSQDISSAGWVNDCPDGSIECLSPRLRFSRPSSHHEHVSLPRKSPWGDPLWP